MNASEDTPSQLTRDAIKTMCEVPEAKDKPFVVQIIQVKHFDKDEGKKNIRMRYFCFSRTFFTPLVAGSSSRTECPSCSA